MQDKEKPLAISFGYFEGDDLCFITKRGILRLKPDAPQREILGILKRCTGLRSIQNIRKQVDIPKRRFHETIHFLLKNQIIFPSNKLGVWFHERTLEDSKYLTEFNPTLFEELKQLKRTKSRKPLNLDYTPLERIQLQRKSSRRFAPVRVSKDELLRTLSSLYFQAGIPIVASAGGFYPLHFHIITLNTELPNGLYKYKPSSSTLKLVRKVPDTDEIFFYLQNRDIFANASFIIIVSADLDIHAQKYSNRGYRYTLIEVGSVVQNAYLKAVENSQGVLAYGGFSDTRLKKYLGLDNNSFPLITMAFGGLPRQRQLNSQSPSPLYVLHDLLEEYARKRIIIEKYSASTLRYGGEEILMYCASTSYKSPPDSTGRDRSGKSFGVGYSKGEAVLKAVAETLERYYSGEFFFDEENTYQNLDKAIHPNRFLMYNPNEATRKLAQFNSDTPYRWVRGHYIKNGKSVLILAEQVFYPLNEEILGHQPIYKVNSSGVAAYPNREGATERALIELVERDAICIAWYGRRKVVQVNSAFLPQNLKEKQRSWRQKGFSVEFYDFTTDSIPVAVCFFRNSKEFPYFVSGGGAGYIFEKSLEKAFSEAESGMLAWREIGDTQIKKEKILRPRDHGLFYAQKKNAHLPFKFLNIDQSLTKMQKHEEYSYQELIRRYDPVEIVLHSSPQLHVVRVMSEKLYPLSFGFGMEVDDHRRMTEMGLNLTNREPHFFP